jgi:hypothetical protein
MLHISSECVKNKKKLQKRFPHLVVYIQNNSYNYAAIHELLQSLPDTYNMSTQKQAPFTVTPPRHGEAQDWRGDM